MIRWKVFLPVLGIVLLVGFIVVYKIDAWLEEAIEDGISSITNTKTEITSLRLSFKNSSLVIKELKIASPKHEFKNLMDFADIVIDFQALPLLEKRFVIDEFSIRGVAWNTDRKTSGWLPPKPKTKEEPSWLSEQIDMAFGRLKDEFQEMPVAKLADFRVPQNPQEILGALDLESEKAFRESVVKFQESRTEWQAKVNELRDVSEYKRFASEVQSLTKNLPKDPKEILERVETAKKAVDFFKNEKDKANNLLGDVKKQANELQDVYKNAVGAIESDYRRARDMVSLDQLNINNLSRVLFGSHWLDEAERVLRYHAILRAKMAALKDEDQGVEVRQRALGRDIIFIVPQKKPGFVLAKSEFSVTGLEKDGADNRLSQTYELKLLDINSAPKLYGKPTEISAIGRFRSAPISLAALDFFWDYTKETPTDRYAAKVEKIDASNWPVGIPKIFPLKIEAGSADSNSKLEFVGSDMKWTNRIQFSGVAWDFREVPKIGFIVPALVDTMNQIKNFFLEIEFLRTQEGGLDFRVRSDMDNQLKAAVMNVIEKKLEEFKAKLKAEIEAQVKKYRAEAEKQLNLYRQEVVGKVEDQLALAQKYQKEAEGKIKELQDKAKSAVKSEVQDKAGKELDKLKKGLPGLKNPF